MEIIMMEKVANLGGLGDVVKVRDGYARNFLIPTGRAKRATKANIAAFEERKAELERLQAEKLAQAEGRAEKLSGFMLQIARKAGMDGKLFGSVTNADIAEELVAQGFDVNRSEIRMPDGPLKAVGDYSVVIALHTDVHVEVVVSVLGASAS